MEGFSLKGRAIVFALCAGATAFILALVATSGGRLDGANAARALIPAIICAAMCWACVERSLAATASAIDAAIVRLAKAARGDLESAIPNEVRECVPPLATAMDALFRQLHDHLDTVRRLAMFDPVTGLANRLNFRTSVETMLSELSGDAKAALFFIDLDRFKSVNDTLGHAIGDQLLAMVADRLREVAAQFASPDGPTPLIGRLSGDEFTVFFADLPVGISAKSIGGKLLDQLRTPFDLADQQVTIGASIGIACRPDHGTTLTDLMRAADQAMYHAKNEGRGRIEPFTRKLAAEIAERERLDDDLRVAIDRDEFTIAFQPQVALAGGHVVAAEALLRWRQPGGSLRLAGSFIGRAEETGLIVEIGEWVIATVAGTIARWSALGVEQRLAINISARELDHAEFFRRLHAAMLAADAPARLLELEITETLAMNCSADTLEAIAALRADGAIIAIDDFGTGYSNLARLRNMPIDRIKIDRSMIENIARDDRARTIVQAVVSLIHGLGFEAVAEGVETQAQAEVLRIAGCDVIQGYAVAPPMDEATFLNWARAEDIRIAV